MSEFRPSNEVPLYAAARCNGLRDRMLIGLMLFILVRSGEALAAEQVAIDAAASDKGAGGIRQTSQLAAVPVMPLKSFTATDFSAVADFDEKPAFSATDFRPRKRTVLDDDPAASSVNETSLLRNTTVWQRLSEYRSHDRVRLLTLWESSGSTVSLQAGRRGDPSLQWTSRFMNRGGSTQGVLDRLFSTSLARAGMGLRNIARPAAAATPPSKFAAPPAEAVGLK
jgi:hypothetical protein